MSYTGKMRTTQGRCELHREDVSYTGKMRTTQGRCELQHTTLYTGIKGKKIKSFLFKTII